jgi:hypothetical protein
VVPALTSGGEIPRAQCLPEAPNPQCKPFREKFESVLVVSALMDDSVHHSGRDAQSEQVAHIRVVSSEQTPVPTDASTGRPHSNCRPLRRSGLPYIGTGGSFARDPTRLIPSAAGYDALKLVALAAGREQSHEVQALSATTGYQGASGTITF